MLVEVLEGLKAERARKELACSVVLQSLHNSSVHHGVYRADPEEMKVARQEARSQFETYKEFAKRQLRANRVRTETYNTAPSCPWAR